MNDLTTTTASTLTLYGGVRLLTKDATFDDLAAADYWDLYQKYRAQSVSLSQFARDARLNDDKPEDNPYPSKAEWSRYDGGEPPRRCIRNGLRKVAGLPLLPETVADTVAEHVSPDATVFFVGEGEVAEAVLLLGDITAYKGLGEGEGYADTTEAPTVDVPKGTRARRRYWRPCLTLESQELVGDDDPNELIALGKQAKKQMEGWL
jgi:hypothetical protein